MTFRFQEFKDKLRELNNSKAPTDSVKLASDNDSNSSMSSIDLNLLQVQQVESNNSNEQLLQQLIKLLFANDNLLVTNVIVADNITSVELLKALIDFGGAIIRLELPYSKIVAIKINGQWITTLGDNKAALYKLQRGMKIRLVFEFTV